MKKLMIAAAAAAMVGGAFAGPCDDPEEVTLCRAWDVKMSLKTLGPKKTVCTIAADSLCEDAEKEVVYYLDNVTRTIKGYLWVCDYECGADFNVCLWDAKNNLAIIPVAYDAISFDEVYAYGKKATKVAGSLAFESDMIEVAAAGINGKLVRGSDELDCYVKSLSGYAAGKLAFIKPGARTISTSTPGTLCGEPTFEEETCEEYETKILSLCDACCFDGWCDAEAAEDMLPAVGTWSMKINKKVSTGKTAIARLVPAYAL